MAMPTNDRPLGKIRYGNRHHGFKVKPTYSWSSDLEIVPLERASYSRPKQPDLPGVNGPNVQRYMGDADTGGRLSESVIAQIVDAIEKTSWAQWVLGKMAADAPGGDCADGVGASVADVRPQHDEPEKMSAAANDPTSVTAPPKTAAAIAGEAAGLRKAAKGRAAGKDNTPFAYHKFDPDQDHRLHVERSQAEQYQRQQRVAAEFAGREDLACRALQHAERHGTSYEDALTACGGSLPTEILPSCVV